MLFIFTDFQKDAFFFNTNHFFFLFKSLISVWETHWGKDRFWKKEKIQLRQDKISCQLIFWGAAALPLGFEERSSLIARLLEKLLKVCPALLVSRVWMIAEFILRCQSKIPSINKPLIICLLQKLFKAHNFERLLLKRIFNEQLFSIICFLAFLEHCKLMIFLKTLFDGSFQKCQFIPKCVPNLVEFTAFMWLWAMSAATLCLPLMLLHQRNEWECSIETGPSREKEVLMVP